ncbi:Morphogenesis-related protein MSB1 [Wickerhamomyces ciferrii]|uniref:Morphogenesis-related protein MSB1 n=1 Tax=Wickerhamomyces ciferrii (strain ATCC 14091 / BCRC 22168 / CBS 111 / JCM 3599 / NBRC 0793 / NRRL Y-1031 F-60-10) TaxID=1206466 RepID=K0KQP5_WICCF|nr:Morphogenesis-related protein MSB1 [Wickerhamomyces ciferrii]CCH44462.1 Morphogenesis-related protein MSB1 [Wickerhamomyces ciferrii]
MTQISSGATNGAPVKSQKPTLAPAKGPTRKKKQYQTDKPLPLPASSRGSTDDDTFVHEFSRTDVRELIHTVTQELKIKGNKTPLVLLAFRPKVDDSKLTTFLSLVFPNGTTPAPINQIERAVRDTDEYTLMAALKYLWSRLPMDSIVGWDAYETFKKLEARSNYPKKAFLEFMPQCLTSPAHASIVYDFLDLLVSLSANAKENQLSGRKISKMAGLWAFHGPPNSANLTKSRLDPTENSFREGLRDWLPAADALFHLFLSFLRSMLPDDQNTKLQLPRTLQALLASNSYPPPDLTFQSSTLVSVPLVTIRSNTLSKNPTELLNKLPKVLSFDNQKRFEAKEDYALLKSLCRNDSNIMNKLSGESRRIIGLLCKKPSEGTLMAGWPEYHPPETVVENKIQVSVSRVSIDDYFIWTWMSSMSFEETQSKKKLFGRSLISEFVFDGFKKWIVVEEQNIESTVRNHNPPVPEKPKVQKRIPSAQPNYKSLILDEGETNASYTKPKAKVLQEKPVPNDIPPPIRKTSVPLSPKLSLLKPFKKKHHDHSTKQIVEPDTSYEEELVYEPPEEVGGLPEIETNQYRLSMPLDQLGFDDDYETPQNQNYQNLYSSGEYKSTAPPRSNYDNYHSNDDQSSYHGYPGAHDAFVQGTYNNTGPHSPVRNDQGIYQEPTSPFKKNPSVPNGSIEDLTQMVSKLAQQVNQVESKLGNGSSTKVPEQFNSTNRDINGGQQDHHSRPSNVTMESQNSSVTSKPRRKPPQGNASYNNVQTTANAPPVDYSQEYQNPNGYYYQHSQPQNPPYADPYPPMPVADQLPAPVPQRSSYVEPPAQRNSYQEQITHDQPYNNQKAPSPIRKDTHYANARQAYTSDNTEPGSYYTDASEQQNVDNGYPVDAYQTPAGNSIPSEYQQGGETIVVDKRRSTASNPIYPESIIETYTTPSVWNQGDSEVSSFASPGRNIVNNSSPQQSKRYSQAGNLPQIAEPLSSNDIDYIPDSTSIVPDVPLPTPSPPRLQNKEISENQFGHQHNYQEPVTGSSTSLPHPSDDYHLQNTDPHHRMRSPSSGPYQHSEERISRDGYDHYSSSQSLGVSSNPQQKTQSVQSFQSAQESQSHIATPKRQNPSPSSTKYETPFKSPPPTMNGYPQHPHPNHAQQPVQSNMYKSPPPQAPVYGTPRNDPRLNVPQTARPMRQTSPVVPYGGPRPHSASPRPPKSRDPYHQPPPQQQPYYPPPPSQAHGYFPPAQGYPPAPQSGQGYPPAPPSQGYYPPPQGYYPPPQQWYPPPQGYGYSPASAPGAPPPSGPSKPTHAATDFAIGHLPTATGTNKLHRTNNKNDKKSLRNALAQGDFGI